MWTLTLDVEMTEASDLRARLLPEIEKVYGARLTFTDMIVKACGRALAEWPLLNSSWRGDAIVSHRHCNIGVAVAVEGGLLAPVVRDADARPLGSIAADLKALAERARAGRATLDDLTGGTFTVTNLGAFGIESFNPIITPGQAAILGVGRIAEKPVARNGQVVARRTMSLCLSFDHRIVDGAPAAQFLQRIQVILESPDFATNIAGAQAAAESDRSGAARRPGERIAHDTIAAGSFCMLRRRRGSAGIRVPYAAADRGDARLLHAGRSGGRSPYGRTCSADRSERSGAHMA